MTLSLLLNIESILNSLFCLPTQLRFLTSHNKYNAFGSMKEVTEPGQSPWTLSYDDAQNLASVKDPRTNTVGYQYDALNRLKKTTQPLGRITDYVYDENSNVTKVTDPKGQTAQMTYTPLGRTHHFCEKT